jgi:hypothetical protein
MGGTAAKTGLGPGSGGTNTGGKKRNESSSSNENIINIKRKKEEEKKGGDDGAARGNSGAGETVKQRARNETTGRAGTGKGRLHRTTTRTSSGKHRKMETGAAGI